MKVVATAANAAWAAASWPAWRRYRRALERPRAAQMAKLLGLVRRHAMSAFGRAHGFETIASYEDFAARVPLADYEALAPWIERIKRGELNVLTAEPAHRLVPTSGTSGARKLIPYTAGFQRELNAAIGPWIAELFRRDPAVCGGRAYWSITPLEEADRGEDSAVPIGFDDDASYLGGARRRLVDAVMAAPSLLRRVRDVAEFRRATLRSLLRCADLRLVSVWHPSYFALLLDELAAHWDELRRDPELRASARRARELAVADPHEPQTIWPELRVISCWGDAHARLAMDELRRRFPRAQMQAKGLLATEACVTIPFAERHPLALTSHFFEFLRDDGRAALAHELREGDEAEVIVTTGGGLWRYRLGDRVRVNGFVGRTPSLVFLGRAGNVCDLRGEKLAEAFVAEAMQRAFAAGGIAPRFALLAPDENDAGGCGYTVYLEGAAAEAGEEAVRLLDRELRANPHYAWCRDFGQLRALRLFRIARGGFETFAQTAMTRGQRLGDIKPAALSRESGWSRRFAGDHLAAAKDAPVLRA